MVPIGRLSIENVTWLIECPVTATVNGPLTVPLGPDRCALPADTPPVGDAGVPVVDAGPEAAGVTVSVRDPGETAAAGAGAGAGDPTLAGTGVGRVAPIAT